VSERTHKVVGHETKDIASLLFSIGSVSAVDEVGGVVGLKTVGNRVKHRAVHGKQKSEQLK
jgi:hypothetical protein